MKVLIVGLGSIAKKQITALLKLDSNVEIFALRRQNSAPAPKELSVEEIFDINKIDTQIDFIIISNPTNLHFQTINNLLSLKKPLFIEKPLVHKRIQSEYLLKLIDNNIINYVTCNLRFHPSLVFIKNLLTNNAIKINEVNAYCGSYLPEWRKNTNYRNSYSANAERGGGVHLDLIHELDYCYWLFGKPEKVISTLKSKSHLKIQSIDYANYLLNYNNFVASVILNYFRKDAKRTLELVTSEATYNIDLLNCSVKKDNNIIFESKNYNIQDSYYEQLKYFVDCLKNNIQPMNSVSEAAEVIKICLNNE